MWALCPQKVKNKKQKIKTMTKFKNHKKSRIAVVTGLFVLTSLVMPLVNGVLAAASFNQGSQPYETFMVTNATQNPNCNSCWSSSSANVGIDEVISLQFFFNNTSGEIADNTRVSVEADVNGDGDQIRFIGKLWADNVSAITKTVYVNVSDEQVENLIRTATKQFNHVAQNVSLNGDANDVVTNSGLLVGDVEPGNGGAGFVVVNFRMEGVDGGGGGGNCSSCGASDEPEHPTGDAPEVETLSASSIDTDSARVLCRVDANGDDTDVRFEWSEDADDLDNDTSTFSVDGDETNATVYKDLTGLDEDTKYYYRCVGENNEGTDTGSVKNFTTDEDGGSTSDKPSVTTLSADNVDGDSARLRCEVDTNGDNADIWFEWGEDSGLDEDTSKVSVSDNETSKVVTKTITGLDEDTKYYFRCRIEDDGGETDTGSTKNFTTDENGGHTSGDTPVVTTLTPTAVTQTSGVLRGDVDANGSDTNVWFKWGTSANSLTRDTSSEDVGDSDNVEFDFTLTNLTANTTYFYRAVAENDEGDDYGAVRSFRTGAPIVNVITRIVETVRPVPVQEEEVRALIITLDANRMGTDENSREIGYTVSYENRTSETFTNAALVVDLPVELNHVDSDPKADDDSDGVLTFNIGTISPDEKGSFVITTEVDADVNTNDSIRFVADVEYVDSGTNKLVTVIDEHTFGELSGRVGGAFTALLLDSLKNFFTSPILWLILLGLLIYFAVRYFAAGRDKRSTALV
jgi:hypothetical protein